MMKIVMRLFAVCVLTGSLFAAEKTLPSCEELKAMIRRDHPRLFLNRETLPQFRKHANSPRMKREMDACRASADKAPAKPVLIANPRLAKLENGKLIITKKNGDQDVFLQYMKSPESNWGRIAAQCAVVYMATGEKKYLEKGRDYLLAFPQLLKTCADNRIMLEWRNCDRMGAIVAWDWLYNDLTPAERKAFMVPLLKYTRVLAFNPGYMTCGGYGFTDGNYGEKNLLWYMTITAMGEPYEKELIGFLFKDGYKNETGAMAWREKISAGTGQLVYPSQYSFGFHPFISCNFLHTLRSAMGIDGTCIYPQIRDYARFVSNFTVPGPMRNGKPGLMTYGWGNAFHVENNISMDFLYTHMAQLIHFFGKSAPHCADEARRVIERLPDEYRKHGVSVQRLYPYLPFILYDFDPAVRAVKTAAKPAPLGTFYPSCGILVTRSGDGPQDTYASVSLGAQMSSGAHYDDLAFVIYKQGFLTAPTGCRGNAPHHLAYWPQTISTNAPLIRMEKEPLPRHWYPQNGPKVDWSKIYCDGGQMKKGVGKHLGIQQTERYVIGAGDATAAYSPKKCKAAVRQFVYIKPDYFIIYDRLESVKPDQQKVFQIHSQTRPERREGAWTATEYKGRLFWKTLLPENARQDLIGGPGREFWTNGRNFPLDPHYDRVFNHERNFLGKYRMEVTDPKAGNAVRFLHVLQASPIAEMRMIPAKLLKDAAHDGAELTLPSGEKVQVRFNRTGKVGAEVRFIR